MDILLNISIGVAVELPKPLRSSRLLKIFKWPTRVLRICVFNNFDIGSRDLCALELVLMLHIARAYSMLVVQMHFNQ